MARAFSNRSGWDLGESAYFGAVRDAAGGSRAVYDLTVSNPTRCGFTYDTALLAPLVNPESLIYDPQPRGLLGARNAIAGYYSRHAAEVSSDQLIVTASTSESYSFVFRLLCDPGDEILIGQPTYPLFDLLATLEDVQLRSYPLFYDHGWWIDIAELERRVTDRTRAIVVVHPNNPTGHWTRAEERARLEELCAARGLALIVDEVFLDYALDPRDAHATSFAVGPHPGLTFVLSGLSKIAGLPQMKAAWIATFGPESLSCEALDRLEVIADTFLSVSAPVQLALPSWLAGADEIQRQVRARVRRNLDVLLSFAAVHPEKLRVMVPEAGWASVISLPSCGGDVNCAEWLAREHGIIVHPGAFYGMSEPNRAIVSLLVVPQVLDHALRLL